MRYLNILADDLTGAADSAARCHHFGLPATIFPGIPELPLPPGAIAFTSDSRHLAAEEAARRARDMAASLPTRDVRWYKKIDSTLRGNIGSELDALLDLLDAPAAVVCPAFPAQERGLRNGKLAAPELALPFSRRQVPKSLEWAPDSAVDLPSLLRQQSRHHVAALSLEEVREGELAARMKQALHSVDRRIRARRTILVVDALTDADLDEVVRAHEEAMPEGLLCGSAGLAGAFAQTSGREERFFGGGGGSEQMEGGTLAIPRSDGPAGRGQRQRIGPPADRLSAALEFERENRARALPARRGAAVSQPDDRVAGNRYGGGCRARCGAAGLAVAAAKTASRRDVGRQ